MTNLFFIFSWKQCRYRKSIHSWHAWANRSVQRNNQYVPCPNIMWRFWLCRRSCTISNEIHGEQYLSNSNTGYVIYFKQILHISKYPLRQVRIGRRAATYNSDSEKHFMMNQQIERTQCLLKDWSLRFVHLIFCVCMVSSIQFSNICKNRFFLTNLWIQ